MPTRKNDKKEELKRVEDADALVPSAIGKQVEMLPKGRASEIPRNILTAHIKDPDFNNQLVAQVEDTAEKDKKRLDTHRHLALDLL